MERPKHIQKEPYAEPPENRARSWIEAYGKSFIKGLQSYVFDLRDRARIERDGGGISLPDELFDPTLRSFEEIPICTFWSKWSKTQPLPLGFRIVKGSVLIDDEYLDFPGQTRRADHQFLIATDDGETVVDHCPAQFYWRRSNDLGRGERLKVTVVQGDALIFPHTLSEGGTHSFLIGRRPEIEDRLGLRYDSQPRSEA